jgi:RNA polymerase sigma factor (sigma-70 family)
MMNDSQLVHEFARTRSPDVLAELAERHSTWLYSAALRMVGDADLAEDVTQAVFVVLVQKAATLDGKPLNAWLFGVARFAAKHALRDRARRQKHERMAAMLTGESTDSRNQETWKAVAPLLDELVGRLKRDDRQAVLLRFYQSKSMAQVGAMLGISEDAAKKRVAKAVKRLRELLGGRGVQVGSDALGAAFVSHMTTPAPPHLVAACTWPIAKKAGGALSIAKGVISMMALTRIKVAALAIATMALIPAAIALALQSPATITPSSQPALAINMDLQADAADLYGQAAQAITVDAPASTSNAYPNYFPSSPEWRKTAADAYAANAYTRELAHKARSVKVVNWPDFSDLGYYNQLRNLANNLGDSALFAEVQGRHAEAISTIRDLMHMRDLLLESANQRALRVVVGIGIDGLTMARLQTITATIQLTDKSNDPNDLQVADAKELIATLLDQIKPMDRLSKTLNPQGSIDFQPTQIPRAIEQMNRVNSEQSLAAISLAAQVYKFENGRWPESLEEMIPNDLPHAMVDPWGNGKQMLGYVLVKGGLPDGSDRPLVYSRCNGTDGLYYHANELNFGIYFNDGTNHPASQLKHYGQFFDVTVWEPRVDYTGPTALPLPAPAKRTGVAVPLHPSTPKNSVLD